MFRDGRRRERALQHRYMHTDRRLLPILVVRTADWAWPVRKQARKALARALTEPPTSTAVGVALEMRGWSRDLTARSSPLRTTAQWAARRLGEDPVELYRAMEPDEPDVLGRVAGLGEVGTSDDLGLVAPFLEHVRPRVRAEAVRAFHRLGGPPRRLGPMFTDPAPVVVRTVSRALRGDSAALPADGLRELLVDRGRPGHVRYAALVELASRDPWTRVEAGLLALSDDDGRLADLAWTSLHRRGGSQYFIAPSDEVRERVRGLIDAGTAELGEDRARRLRWALGLHR